MLLQLLRKGGRDKKFNSREDGQLWDKTDNRLGRVSMSLNQRQITQMQAEIVNESMGSGGVERRRDYI